MPDLVEGYISRPHVSSGASEGYVSLREAMPAQLRELPVNRHSCDTKTLHDGINRPAVSNKRVAILLATYQGGKYISEQLDSIASQTHKNWEVWASDDGSDDNSRQILETYKRTWGSERISIHDGPQEGFVSNFLSLVCRADIQADLYAYCDQDDLWEAGKLERAIAWLNSVTQDRPALYCGRTRLVDEHDGPIGLSPLFSKPPSFSNALVQNIGGGNTMVFNSAARTLLCEAGECVPAVSHDWWAYMLVTGCGGRVLYDATPTLRYRQHENNLVGMNSSWSARITRICMLWQGRFRWWNDRNIEALKSMSHRLTPESLNELEQFVAARQMSLFARLFHLRKSGIHRQTFLGNLGLIAAAVFRKL